MSKLLFGWSEIDITPEKKVSLRGQFAERISEYVEKPLTATALAVSSDDDHMIMVGVDIIAISCNLVAAIRERLAAANPGFDPQKVFLSAIHTHTGPDYDTQDQTTAYTPHISLRQRVEALLPPGKKYIENARLSDNPDIATNEEIFDMLTERLSKVVLDAWNNRAPGSFSNAFGRAAVGNCRRACFSDGSAQMWGETATAMFTELETGCDTGIELLYVNDAEGNLKGIVANLACPAQSVQHRLFVSPDFWGEAKVRIRKHFGDHVFLLPQCSAAGDQCPVDLIRWVEPESDVNDPNINRKNPVKRNADPSMFDLAGMRVVGRRIANEIIEVYEAGLPAPITDAEFEHQVHVMHLPLRRATLTDVKNAKRALKEYIQDVEGDVNYNDSAMMLINLGLLIRAEVQEKMDIVNTEVHLVRMGPIAFATNPFELFLNYGNLIKARSLAEQTFVVQLCNGGEGYLPTEKAEHGGHYSDFIASGLVGHVGGEQLVRETVQGINNMFSK